MYVVTLSGKQKNMDMLQYAAAMLECRMGWCTLAPIKVIDYINFGLYKKASTKTTAEKDSILLEVHKQKINLSNALYVYFGENELFKDYKTSDTLKEINYAMDKNLDIYFSNLPKDINDDYTYNEYLDRYIKPLKYTILDGGKYKTNKTVHEIPMFTYQTLNLIKVSYLEPKLYERAKHHGVIA